MFNVASGGTMTDWLRRESVVWSGAFKSSRINRMRESTKPSVCLSGRWNTERSVSAVTIAMAEYRCCPPGRPLELAFHESMASSSNQNVMSPRFLRAASYAGQFFNLYFVFYFGVTLLFVLAAIT